MENGVSDFQIGEVIARAIKLDNLSNKEKGFALKCQLELTTRLKTIQVVQERVQENLVRLDPTYTSRTPSWGSFAGPFLCGFTAGGAIFLLLLQAWSVYNG